MARCGCAQGSASSTLVVGSSSVDVAGNGTAENPYVLSLDAIGERVDGGVGDGTTTGVSGAGSIGDPRVVIVNLVAPEPEIYTPTTGQTKIVSGLTDALAITPAGTIATHTITLPATTAGAVRDITFVTSATITALTVNGAVGTTVAGMPTTLAANAYFRVKLFGTVWRRVG